MPVCLFATYQPHTFPGAVLRDRLACGHRTNESPIQTKNRSRSPVQGAECWRDLRLFVFVGSPTRRQRTPMKPHTLSPLFLSGSQPPPTNVQHAVSSHTNVIFNEPNPGTQRGPVRSPLAAEAWPARKRSLWREDVLRQTIINQECMATWEKSELLTDLLRNSQLPSIPDHNKPGVHGYLGEE